MAPRFLFLLSEDPLLAGFGIHVADQFKRAYPDVWIGLIYAESLSWLIAGFPLADQSYPYLKTPGKSKQQILDDLPDYLIDLSDNARLRLFKNRLRVADFTLSHRLFKRLRAEPGVEEQLQYFQQGAAEMLGFFEMADPRRIVWSSGQDQELQAKHLPNSYLEGYVACFLDQKRVEKIGEKRVIKLLSMLEYPTVLLGDKTSLETGDRIVKSVGCSVFNTAGVLNQETQLAVSSGARSLLGFSEQIKATGFLLSKTLLILGDDQNVPSEQRMMDLKNQLSGVK